MPSGPVTTAFSAASSAILEITMSAPRAAAAAVSATTAPADRNGSAFSDERFQTTSG